MKIRVGFGFDVHPLKEGHDFFLGGIKIPHTKGTIAHSDGDALIHAICDALLGAAGLGDIGFHFPDTAAEWKGIDSKILLAEVAKMLNSKGYSIMNIDTTVCLEAPKIRDYKTAMAKTIALTLDIPEDAVSVKATTNEKLGYIGREEGVACYASVLISGI